MNRRNKSTKINSKLLSSKYFLIIFQGDARQKFSVVSGTRSSLQVISFGAIWTHFKMIHVVELQNSWVIKAT